MNFLYNKNQVYTTRYFVYTYNDNDLRIVKSKYCKKSGFEEIKKFLQKPIDIDYNSEEIERCSLSRTKRNIREIALSNNFEYFSTLTINSKLADRYSLDEVQTRLKKILKKIKRKYNDFRYIFITEKHLDGAFHFHGLIGGLPSDIFYTNINGFLSYKLFDDELGFNSFSPIKDYSKCCNYITKYITQECIRNSHNQVYISSRGLKKATREEFSFIDFKPSFTNDFCEIKDIQLNKLNQDEILKLFYDLKKEK